MLTFTGEEKRINAVFVATGLGDYDSHKKVYSQSERMIYRNAVINPGRHYSTHSGKYTCPVSGLYFFSYSIQGDDIKQGWRNSQASASLLKDGTRMSQIYVDSENNANIDISLSRSDIVQFNEGERVWVESCCHRNRIFGHPRNNIFSGLLLYMV